MKLTKKLFIAIMTMALLVVTFSASTFAWFTLDSSSKIDNFQVNVQTAAGMEISEDGSTWKNNIELADISTNLKFEDLTSTNGVNVYQMNKEDGQPVAATAGSNYFEKVIYVRITKNTTETGDFDKIILDSVSGKDRVFDSDAKRWLSDVTLAGPYNGKSLTANAYAEFDALNAVKISFTAGTKATANVIYAYENDKTWGDAANTGLAKDYAEAKDYDLTNAVALGTVTYTKYTKADGAAADANGFVKYDQGTKATVLTAGSTGSEFGAFSTLGLSVTNYDDTNYLYAKLTIRVWLEGWDADCINAILEQETEFSIVLKGQKNS